MPATACKSAPRKTITPQPPAAIRRALLRWYRRHRRDLPWRPAPGSKANAYHVLVSEMMLQQTQVATVLPYFAKFIKAFPGVRDLADADEQAVLRLWQGLGYYRRARHLHAAARMIVDQHDGRVPAAVVDLLKLPGVGRYVAGAVASIAYDTPAPILDGNVARVLSRLYAITTPIDTPATRKQLWSLADNLVPKLPGAGDFNQGLMELGALICTPKSPSCLLCPLSNHCRARQAGKVSDIPARLPRRQPKQVEHHILAVERRGKYLFEQRPPTGLWSNMWQLPTLESPAPRKSLPGDAGFSTHHADPKTPDLRAWCRDRFGLTITPPRVIDTFTHQTTHRTIHFTLHHATTPPPAPGIGGRLRPGAGTWRKLNSLSDLPLPNPQHKATRSLTKVEISLPRTSKTRRGGAQRREVRIGRNSDSSDFPDSI